MKVRIPRDGWRLIHGAAGRDLEVDAIVVKSEPRDGRGVPPVEVERAPIPVCQRRLEIGSVPDDPAGDTPQPVRLQRIRDGVYGGPRRVTRPRCQRVDRVAALRPGRIATPIQDQIPFQHAIGHCSVRIDARPHAVIGREQDGRRSGYDQLGVARRHGEVIAVAVEHDVPAIVLGVDIPGRAIVRRLIEQPCDALLQRAVALRLERSRGANRKRREDQLSHRARR